LPELTVHTGPAREALPEQVALVDAVRNLRNLMGLIDAVTRADLDAFVDHLHDQLAFPSRLELWPFLEPARAAAKTAGAPALSVSGSGPALFAPCPSEDVARRVVDAVTWAIGGQGWVAHAAVHGAALM
jgi:homoserine kinase